MTDLSEARPDMLTIISNTERSVARLLPLLSLVETPEEGPDRIGQLLELLNLLLDAQRQQAAALKGLADRIERLPRR